MRAIHLVMVLTALLACQSAFAQFEPVSQKRYVFESVGEDFFVNPAPDFGQFNASFTAVSQDSTIAANSIFGQGSAGPDPTFSINSATSFFEVIFNVQAATPFVFTGAMTTGPEFGSGLVQLGSENLDIVNLVSSGGDAFQWNESGILAPGQYTLQVFVSNSIGSDLSNFEFSLRVPGIPGLGVLALAPWISGVRRRR